MSRTYRKLPYRSHRSMGRCFKNRLTTQQAIDELEYYGIMPTNRMRWLVGTKSVPVCADDLSCSAWEQVHPTQWQDW